MRREKGRMLESALWAPPGRGNCIHRQRKGNQSGFLRGLVELQSSNTCIKRKRMWPKKRDPITRDASRSPRVARGLHVPGRMEMDQEGEMEREKQKEAGENRRLRRSENKRGGQDQWRKRRSQGRE